MPDLRKGYWVEIVPVVRHDGSTALCFVAKRTFVVPQANLVVEPLDDDAQPPLQIEDRYDEGDAETAAPTLEGDLAPEKAGADVIVIGKSYAPGGKPMATWEASLRIGAKIRRLRLIGPRRARWQPPKKRSGEMVRQPPVIDAPTPIKEVVLSLANAYGGKSRVIPDPAEFELVRSVQAVMAEEKAADDAIAAKANEKKVAAAAVAKEDAARDAIVNAPMGELDDEKGLRRARGEFGYDREGVRHFGEATSQRGTAVMDLDGFERWQAAQAVAEAAVAGKDAALEDGRRAKLRRDIDGLLVEVDDGVEMLDAEKLAKERIKAAADQAEWRAEWAKSAKKRARQQVQSNDGTQMIDISGLDDDDDGDASSADAAWEAKLHADLEVADAERRAVLREELEAARKERAARLAEFPELPCPTNPYGKGFIVSNVRDLIDALELPLIEDPDVPLTAGDLIRDMLRLDDVPLPAGFSTWPRSARPRIDKAGAYPDELASFDDVLQAQRKAADLEKPEDVALVRELDKKKPPGQIQPGFFNSAAPTLQLDLLVGDEEIELENLTKSGHLIFRLPARVAIAELDRGRGVERQDLVLDTLIIEPDLRQVSLVWRTHFAIAGFDELADYPQLVGWVLDLDVKDKRAADWADAAAKKRGDGTAIIDLDELAKMERGEDYWRTISDDRLAAEGAAAPEGTAALDLREISSAVGAASSSATPSDPYGYRPL